MAVFELIRGTLESLFHLGVKGPAIKNNANVVEVRDNADAAYADFRAADVVLDDGGTAVRLKENAGVLEFRNTGDSAYIVVRGGSPSGADDLAPKSYVDAQAAATEAVKMVKFQVDFNDQGATQDSTATLPANSRVVKAAVNVTTPFNGTTPVIDVGTDVTADLFFDQTELDAEVVGFYVKEQDTESHASLAKAIRCAVGGTGATAGVADIIVYYVEAPQA